LLFLVAAATAALRYPDESVLIERLQKRDPEALGEVYDRYGRVAYAVILRIVRDQALAEDLLQESLLRVWNRVSVFDAARGSLGPWLLTIARNQALDYKRSVEGRIWSGVDASAPEHPTLFQGVDDDLLAAERVQQIRAAIARLNENHRTVIELAYFEGLSQTQIAERLAQPLGTVKSWIRAALRLIREELGLAAVV
jgi:RNA polymerase sigma-70 factor (ECF subfamily)